jgi:hypothetical protein
MKLRKPNNFQLNISFLFIILFFQVIACKAQSSVSTDSLGPKIQFESDTINYGTIAHNSDPYRTIKFTNKGSAPLLIENVVGDVVYPVKYPKTPVLTEQTEEIKVSYPTDRIGPFINFIVVSCNGNPNQKMIFVKGKVIP